MSDQKKIWMVLLWLRYNKPFQVLVTMPKRHFNKLSAISERVQNLKRYCASESMYLALWSRPNLMTKTQAEAAMKEKKEKMKAANVNAVNARMIVLGRRVNNCRWIHK